MYGLNFKSSITDILISFWPHHHTDALNSSCQCGGPYTLLDLMSASDLLDTSPAWQSSAEVHNRLLSLAYIRKRNGPKTDTCGTLLLNSYVVLDSGSQMSSH